MEIKPFYVSVLPLCYVVEEMVSRSQNTNIKPLFCSILYPDKTNTQKGFSLFPDFGNAAKSARSSTSTILQEKILK